MCKAKELQKIIDDAKHEIERLSQTTFFDTPHKIASEQSKIFIAASQLAEISTRRIIFLTWALLIVTIALFAVEVRAVFFPKNPDADANHIQSSQHEQVFVPRITN